MNSKKPARTAVAHAEISKKMDDRIEKAKKKIPFGVSRAGVIRILLDEALNARGVR